MTFTGGWKDISTGNKKTFQVAKNMITVSQFYFLVDLSLISVFYANFSLIRKHLVFL